METKRDERCQLPLSAEEKDLLKKAAKTAGLSWAQWARVILLPAARRVLGGAR